MGVESKKSDRKKATRPGRMTVIDAQISPLVPVWREDAASLQGWTCGAVVWCVALFIIQIEWTKAPFIVIWIENDNNYPWMDNNLRKMKPTFYIPMEAFYKFELSIFI